MSWKTTFGVLLALAAVGAGGYAWSQAADGEGVGPEGPPTSSVDRSVIRVTKTASCGCCSAWVAHLRESGFRVETEDVGAAELVALKRERGVPSDLFACHTAIVDGYVIEGHVPAADIRRLLTEKPAGVEGLAVPGMPAGSPGMEVGGRREPYDVVAFGADGRREVFASH